MHCYSSFIHYSLEGLFTNNYKWLQKLQMQSLNLQRKFASSSRLLASSSRNSPFASLCLACHLFVHVTEEKKKLASIVENSKQELMVKRIFHFIMRVYIWNQIKRGLFLIMGHFSQLQITKVCIFFCSQKREKGNC